MRQAPTRSSLEHQAPHATRRIQGTIAVRAKKKGVYDHHVKDVGDEFTIQNMKELGTWMELVDDAGESETGEQPEKSEQPANGEQSEKPATPKSSRKPKPEPTGPAPKSENDVL
jgi:hypothetical protein